MLNMRGDRTSARMLGEADSPAGEVFASTVEASILGKRKLTFVIAHLGPGGAQRVAVNAANALVERGFEVHVVVINDRPGAYPLDPRVVVHAGSPLQGPLPPIDTDADDIGNDTNLGTVTTSKPNESFGARLLEFAKFVLAPLLPAARLVWHALTLRRRASWLRREIKAIEPEAVLSFLTQTNILTVLATRGLRTHTVISERNDPRLQRHRPSVEFLRWVVYRWADVVTANSQGALVTLESFVPKQKLAFLPNPLLPTSTDEVFDFGAPTVVTVGRLVEQKGLDVLLAAWAKAVEALPDLRLALVGDGPLASELKALAHQLKVENTVYWLGHVSDPFPLLRGAKFFVLTSRFEGTPNALLEAMACGLPAVVSNASPGPCELIGLDERAGLIVPVNDAGATAEAIIRLAGDERLRRRLALAARERARAHDVDQAIDVWLRLLRCE